MNIYEIYWQEKDKKERQKVIKANSYEGALLEAKKCYNEAMQAKALYGAKLITIAERKAIN